MISTLQRHFHMSATTGKNHLILSWRRVSHQKMGLQRYEQKNQIINTLGISRGHKSESCALTSYIVILPNAWSHPLKLCVSIGRDILTPGTWFTRKIYQFKKKEFDNNNRKSKVQFPKIQMILCILSELLVRICEEVLLYRHMHTQGRNTSDLTQWDIKGQ